jgi:aspartate 1-decarboxylase
MIEIQQSNNEKAMLFTICTGKLHRVRVTQARLDYEGSITIDIALMEAAHIKPFQLLHINNMRDATHWETYAIPGVRDSGEICLNGCPAHLFSPGDEVIILSLNQLSLDEMQTEKHYVVHADIKNKITRVDVKNIA